jgi:hypothetical protein
MNLFVALSDYTLNLGFLTENTWPILGFGLLLLLLILVIARGKPRQEPSVVISDPPIRQLNDPIYIRRRARAAAAAVVMHRKRHANGELDEER